LHDVMRIPVIGNAYYEWGWVNQLFVLLGMIVTMVGGGLVGLSLQGGVVRETDSTDDAGGSR